MAKKERGEVGRIDLSDHIHRRVPNPRTCRSGGNGAKFSHGNWKKYDTSLDQDFSPAGFYVHPMLPRKIKFDFLPRMPPSSSR